MYLFANKIEFINKILQKNKSYIYYNLNLLINLLQEIVWNYKIYIMRLFYKN